MSAAAKSTQDQILDVAQRLVQAHGFSGFSYADIASAVGIRKASIHHHFPTKGALAKELMARYRKTFAEALERIDREERDSGAKLRRYQSLFGSVLRDDHRLCMCGMLAADFAALPKAVRDEVRSFFDDNERWLLGVLAQGKKARRLSFRGSTQVQAKKILSTLEGAMLVARSYGDVARFDAVAEALLADLRAGRR